MHVSVGCLGRRIVKFLSTLAAIGGFAALSLGVPAQAAVVSTGFLPGTFTAPTSSPNCATLTTCSGPSTIFYTVALPQFNPAMYGGGTLISYVVELSGALSGSVVVTNNGLTNASISPAASSLSGSIANYNGFTNAVAPNLGIAFTQTLLAEGYNPPQVITPGNSKTFTVAGVTGTQSTGTVTTGLGLVTGAGTFDVLGEAFGGFAIPVSGGTGGGGVNLFPSVNATVSMAIRYNYDNGITTPEPASMAMLGMGLIALGAYRRKRHS